MNKTLDYHLPDPPRKPVRLGVVGLGFIFHNCHGPALRFLRQHGWPVELVAVADVKREALARATAAWSGVRTYPTASALLAGETLDGVLLLTWPPHSATQCREALSRVPAVFVEKPVAYDSEIICRLAEEAAGKHVQVGYNRRHMPRAVAFRQTLQAVDATRQVSVRFLRMRQPEPHFYEDTLGHPLDFLRSCFHTVRIATAEAEPLQPGHSFCPAIRVTGFCDAYPFTLESRPAAGYNLEEYAVRGAATNLCIQHPPGTTSILEQDATLYAQGMIHQLASFIRLASGDEHMSSCTLADALAARRLVEACPVKQYKQTIDN